MKKISIICVNYNNSEYTKKMLKSLSRQILAANVVSLRCMVINNSTDPVDSSMLESICSQYSWVYIKHSKENIGYFGGLNLGLQEITRDNEESIIICNNDLYFNDDFIFSYISSNYLENVYVVCPDVVTVDGTHQNPHHLNSISLLEKIKFDLYFSNFWLAVLMKLISSFIKSLKNKENNNDKFYQIKEGAINQGVGACYILTPKFFENCGLKLFFKWFLYGEEACLSWQVRSNGGISWFDPALIVQHDESASTSKLPARKGYNMAKKSYWGYRNLL